MVGNQAAILDNSEAGAASLQTVGLSTAKPIACSPLSTYNNVPVTELANGEAKNAAAFPTSSAEQYVSTTLSDPT